MIWTLGWQNKGKVSDLLTVLNHQTSNLLREYDVYLEFDRYHPMGIKAQTRMLQINPGSRVHKLHLKHTTTLFFLFDHYILSREWRVIVDQVQTNYRGRSMVL